MVETTNHETAATASGPGRRLRQIREAKAMSLETAANKLRLDASVVSALEADDADRLPAPTYVRGYIRTYARLLDVPSEPLLAAYTEQGIAPPPMRAMGSVEEQTKPLLPGSWRWAVYALIGLAVIAGSVAFWQGRAPEQAGDAALSPSLPAAVGEAEVERYDGSGYLPITPLQGPGDEDEVLDVPGDLPGDPSDAALEDEPLTEADLLDDDLADDMDEDGEFLVAEGESDLDVLTADEEDDFAFVPDQELPSPVDAPLDELLGDVETIAATSPTVPTGEAMPEPVPGAAPLPQTPGPAPTPPPTEAAAKPAPPILHLSLGKEAWVSIRDADGKRLVYKVLPKGTEREVTGKPPLRVVIGNAESVTVTLDGKPFDTAPYRQRGVAKFSVGG